MPSIQPVCVYFLISHRLPKRFVTTDDSAYEYYVGHCQVPDACLVHTVPKCGIKQAYRQYIKLFLSHPLHRLSGKLVARQSGFYRIESI